ncbi:MAG: hypothetical protein JWM41_4693 [Gemmatimonadetes bacterium]|nr:hypothetical protein [Gemmatimonadota bacterium]
MNDSGVLIFSTDPLAAALLGAAVELAGFVVHFPHAGESPRDALMRTRPTVALVDCDHEEACTESFFGPAMMAGATIGIFSSKHSRRTLEPIAAQFGVRTFGLPIDFDELSSILAAAAAKRTT